MFLEQHEFLVAAVPRLRTAIFQPSALNGACHRLLLRATMTFLWWYLASSLVAVFVSIFAVEYWHVQLRRYGVLLAFAVTLVFLVEWLGLPVPGRCYRTFGSSISVTYQ